MAKIKGTAPTTNPDHLGEVDGVGYPKRRARNLARLERLDRRLRTAIIIVALLWTTALIMLVDLIAHGGRWP